MASGRLLLFFCCFLWSKTCTVFINCFIFKIKIWVCQLDLDFKRFILDNVTEISCINKVRELHFGDLLLYKSGI